MEAEAHDRALRQLQGALLVLKSKYEQLTLSKTPAGKSADAPFPITITATVDAPSAANRYDVDHLDLKIKLSSTLLQDTPAANALTVTVLNPELPAALRTRISKQLHSSWLARATNAAAAAAAGARVAAVQVAGDSSSTSSGAGPFGLAGLLNHVQQSFVQLITLLPGLVEPYEGTDALGATQRRYAIVENAAAIAAADAAAEAASPAAPLGGDSAQNAPVIQPAAAASVREVLAAPTELTAAPVQRNAPATASSTGGSSSMIPKEHVGRLTDVTSGTVSLERGSSESQPAAAAAALPPRLPPLAAAESPEGVLSAAAAAAAPWSPSIRQSILSSQTQVSPVIAAAPMPYRPPGLRSPAVARADATSRHSSSLPSQQQPQHLSTQQQHQQQQQMHSVNPPAAPVSPGQQQQQQQMHGIAAPAGVAAAASASPPAAQLSSGQAGVCSDAISAAAAGINDIGFNPSSSGTGLTPSQTGGSATRGSGRSRGRGRGRWLAAHAGAAAGIGPYGARGFQQQQQQQQQQLQLPAHILAQQDLATVQRRYGKSFRLATQQQQQPEQQQQQQEEEDHFSTAQHFSLMLRPTDPLWGARRGALHVTGVVNPAQYSAAGSITLTVNPSLNVAAAETWVLQSRLEQEAQKYVSSARQVLSLLKWLENYAGSVLEEFYQAQQQLFGQEQQQPEQYEVQQQQQQQRQLQAGRGSTCSTGCGRGQLYRGRDYQYYDQPQQQQQQQRSYQPQQQLQGQLTQVRQQQQQRPAVVRPSSMAASAASAGGGIKVLRAAKPGAYKSGAPAAAVADVAAMGSNADTWGSEPHLNIAAAAAGQHGWASSGGEQAEHSSSSSSSSSSRELFPSGHKGMSKPQRDPFAGDDFSSNSSHDTGNNSSSEYTTASDSGEHESSSADSDGEPANEVQLHGESAADGSGSGPGGYALTLNGLQLDNIGVMEIVHAHLQLLCDRCQASLAVVLTAEGSYLASSSTSTSAAAAGLASPGRTATTTAAAAAAAAGSKSGPSTSSKSRAFEWAGACAVCSQELGVLLRPRFVHEGNNVIAGLKVQGCKPLDLLPSVYGSTCADCDAVGALIGLQIGVAASRKCSHCHRTISCHIPAASFVPRGPPSAAAAAARVVRPRKKAGTGGKGGAVLQEGSPLPMNGACKHYKHSYRWLRFPCCGQRYACDLCHEEATADGHDAAWATRMVCGFCSCEQPLDKSCKYCGKKLATSAAQPSGRNTRFWEGGKGCRDVKMLDRRDAHKYRNSKAKTKSAKTRRVGPKPRSESAAVAGGGGGGGGSS